MYVGEIVRTSVETRTLHLRRNGDNGWESVNDYDLVEEFTDEDDNVVWAQLLGSWNDNGEKLVPGEIRSYQDRPFAGEKDLRLPEILR